MNRRAFFIICVSFLLSVSNHWLLAEEGAAFKPAFYAFQNGVEFGNLKEEARALKALGYSGVSQVKHGGEKLAQKIKAYEAEGLHVLSIYLDVHDKPITQDVVEPFAGKMAMIELTIRKRHTDPAKTIEAVRKTAIMAEKMKIKVGLYPHYGFGIATFAQAIEMAEKVNHPNLGVIFNVCHFLRGEKFEQMEALLKRADQKLFAVTTNGADVSGKNWKQLIQTLDKGDFPQVKLFRSLKRLGFSGPVGLQCYGLKGDKRQNLESSMKAWREISRRISDGA